MRYRFYSLAKQDQADDTNELLALFHHIHHKDGEHEVHHCGGAHAGVEYTIRHCQCGKHSIDKQVAVGHATDDQALQPTEIEIRFVEQCPGGGWHVESGAEAKRAVQKADDLTWEEVCGEDLNEPGRDTR